MQVSLGRKGDYAVRAMLALARAYGDGRRKARQISQVMDIPERYLPQVMAPLVRGGLVQATAGPDGGYELAHPPHDITLLQVIEAAEGPIAGDQCLLEGGPCDWKDVCPVHEVWSRAHTVLATELRSATFDQLALSDERLEDGTFEIPPGPLHPRSVARRGIRATEVSDE